MWRGVERRREKATNVEWESGYCLEVAGGNPTKPIVSDHVNRPPSPM